MIFWIGSGANEYKTLEPSNGGIGIMLNTPIATFNSVNVVRKFINIELSELYRRSTAPISASSRFESGPAIATKATPNS
jgi:hypothetical protein